MRKILFFLCFIFFGFIQTSIAQCTNPTPTGSDTQTFCEIDNNTVGDLVANGGSITWYNSLTGGYLLRGPHQLEFFPLLLSLPQP